MHPLEDDKGPLEFVLKDNKEHINLEETTLTVKVKITNADGTAIDSKTSSDAQVALVNNAMHSLFRDVELQINGKCIEGGDNMYAYKSYISSMFRFSKETQEGQLFSIGFIRDDHAAMETISNSAFVKRKAWTNSGAVMEFKGKLNLSLFNQQRFLIPRADLYFKFERAKDTFAIFNNSATLKPKVKSINIQMQIVQLHPEVVHQHAEMLSRGIPALYPMQRVEIDSFVVMKDSTGDYKDLLFHGKVPKYIIMI